MISEIDIRDYEMGTQPTKLYDVKRDTLVTPVFDTNMKINFFNVDGMYSYCKLFGTDNVIHLPAWEEVFVWNKK